MAIRSRLDWFHLGREYYVMGRFGISTLLLTVAATCLHHAIEMFLKGYLCATISDDDLKRKFGHNLPKLWARFRQEVTDPQLAEFDQTTAELDEFEDLRYPLEDYAAIWMTFPSSRVGGPAQPAATPPKVHNFSLVTGEVDRLVVALYKHAGCHLIAGMGPDAVHYLTKDNPCANDWQSTPTTT